METKYEINSKLAVDANEHRPNRMHIIRKRKTTKHVETIGGKSEGNKRKHPTLSTTPIFRTVVQRF